MTQEIIIFGIVLIALLFLIQHFWKQFFKKKDSCSSCGIAKAIEKEVNR
jgi:endonuclease III-like uncharacterized protein